ncbi:hypothetical protein [Thalassotalea ganghwensis]
MKQSELTRLRKFEEENKKLKKMFADVSLQNIALKGVIEKKAVKPSQRKQLAQYAYGRISELLAKLNNLILSYFDVALYTSKLSIS